MTTVVLSPPSGPSSPPTTGPNSSKSVLMAVAVDSTASSASKEASPTESDSPTTTAIDLGLEQLEDEQEDVENLKRRANTDEDQRPTKKRRRVVFESADIVEFEPTVYTTSVTSGGVPVGLSLNERSRSRRRLDSYEMERENEGRVGRQNYMEEGYLDPQEREIILNNAGCEEPAIASVEAEVNTIIQHRRESNEIDYEFMYGVGELEDDVDEEDASTGLTFDQDDGSAEDEEESEEEQENSVEEEMAAADETPSEDCSVEPEPEQERYQETEAKTKVHPSSDDISLAAPV